jgi:hypothetical protein
LELMKKSSILVILLLKNWLLERRWKSSRLWLVKSFLYAFYKNEFKKFISYNV